MTRHRLRWHLDFDQAVRSPVRNAPENTGESKRTLPTRLKQPRGSEEAEGLGEAELKLRHPPQGLLPTKQL